MKLLVLALCVCAASALTAFGKSTPARAQASASVSYQPEAVAKAAPLQVKSAPGGADQDAEIVMLESNIEPGVGYSSAYETGNGISAKSTGELQGEGEKKFLRVSGMYRYMSDGAPVEVRYVADENGYRPEGDSLPTPPPTPPVILRLLDYLKEHPWKEETPKKA